MVVRFYSLQVTRHETPFHSGQRLNNLVIYHYYFRETSCSPNPSELKSLKKMAGPRIAHATLKGPSVVKEIIIGITLGIAAGSVWKMHHWNEQRKVRTFYDLLEKGEISTVVEEEE
ncbi:hypothetical protein PIB30_024101 [Stylosanthes scabra]|uniref:Cytochrome c oxidase subunit 5C n=1 Tax=Stylosanthes scabra TaxID=79078 RepID=A0ABU6UBR5_9FABA|nr:hypothetical protein [Stylosanthes scabra]